MKKTFLKHKRKILIIPCIIILSVVGYILYQTVYLDYVSPIKLKLIESQEITINVFDEYKEAGAQASFRGQDITKYITTKGVVDTNKVGIYEIKYIAKYKNKKKTITRKINVVDTVVPEIKLNGESKYSIYTGVEFNDPGVQATDNYDGDISSSVAIDSNLNINTPGSYTITYTSRDSSGNTTSTSREIEVKNKVIKSQGVAVLNYHFFYSDGESCNESICLNTRDFEAQLKYLKDNGYKTLTMDEFVRWIYGEIEVPEKSVLLTIDDGAMGTGAHNGNKLIPLLEKYEAHATLFLITGWWNINNYKSEYLDIESHTYDMHKEGLCSEFTRGAQLLCSTYDQVINDLQKSIAITGSKNAFCYPFYAYNDTAIQAVKEVGFKVAFAGGGYKATRNSNKYAIPRYPIQKTTSLNTFINYIS